MKSKIFVIITALITSIFVFAFAIAIFYGFLEIFIPASEIFGSFPEDEFGICGGCYVFGMLISVYGTGLGVVLLIFMVKCLKFVRKSLSSKEDEISIGSSFTSSIKYGIYNLIIVVISVLLLTLYWFFNSEDAELLWPILIPIVLLILILNLVLLGWFHSRNLDISLKKLWDIGAKEREMKRKEKKRKKAEERKIAQERRLTKRPLPSKIQTSTPRYLSETKRLEKLDIIVKRTEQLRLTDLRNLLNFQDKSSLMDWLYSLSAEWKFSIKGDFITFQLVTDEIEEETLVENVTTKIKTKKVEKRKSLCLFCEAKLEVVEDEGPIVCQNCGKEAPYCEICKNIIIAGEKVVQSTVCGHIFHKKHIIEWIKVKGACPVCKEKLNENGLITYYPPIPD